MSAVRMLKAGERGLVVEFGNVIDAVINARVHQLAKVLMSTMRGRVLEVVPTYRSLFVNFDPLSIERQSLILAIEKLLDTPDSGSSRNKRSRIVSIPVCYEKEFGPDLDFVAAHNNLSVDDVVEIHTSGSYVIYMLGFTPGFPYLGGMSERIATPRLDKPRVKIPAGSVGIGGKQTGIYPIESPGGWRIIGRMPLKAFNPSSSDPFLFAAGDYLEFHSITSMEYHAISRDVDNGRYSPVIKIIEQESC
jgi:inhibitor of KinA